MVSSVCLECQLPGAECWGGWHRAGPRSRRTASRRALVGPEGRTAPFPPETDVRREENATRGMAIFHMHAAFGSRQTGQSALAKAAYLLRLGKYARSRDDLVDGFWGNLPDWCDDGLALFEAADRYERANARLFYELEGALPCELTLGQNIELALTMAHEATASGLPYLLVIHDGRPPAPGVPRNRHWHLQFLERINDGLHRPPERWFRRANRQNPAAGGALKDRRLKGHEWLPDIRRRYEQLINAALERAGCPERVTAASHEDRIARAEADGDYETAKHLRRHPPGLHVGPVASAIERGRPGRNERSTERGDLARSREAEAARLRADLERVEGELTEHHRAAVAAARDAGVEEVLIAAAKPGDPDTVIALDGATETRRREIRAFARKQGFDDDVIHQIRRMGQPDDPDLGWTDVVESIEANVGQVERARALGLPVDVDAVVADARRRGTNPVRYLVQVNEIWDTARRAGLSNQGLNDIYGRAEQRQAGTGWSAIEDATAERVERKSTLEAAARSVFVDIEAVYGNARDRNEDELDAIEGETARAKPVVLAARAAGLGDSAIGRICRDAELKEYGTGWAAVSQATAERVERRSAAETAARELDLSVEFIYASTSHGADPVDHLEGVTAMWGRARRAGLSNQGLNDIYGRAEKRQAGTGWSAIEDATVERVERKSTLEAAARSFFVDVEAVYGNARDRNEDELDAIEGETATAQPVVLAAWAAGLDDAAIKRILDTAASEQPGSVWRAVSEATEAEAARLRAELERVDGELEDLMASAEAAARDAGVNLAAVADEARSDQQDVATALLVATEKRRLEILEEARAAGLDDDEIDRVRREAKPADPDLGWLAVAEETAALCKRAKAELERLEADIRATSTGGERLDAALRDRLGEGGRELTIAERKSIVEPVGREIRNELENREQAVAATDDGAALLRKARGAAGDSTSPTTLAAHECSVARLEHELEEAREAAACRRRQALREAQEKQEKAERRREGRLQEVERNPIARVVCRRKLDDIAPGWEESEQVPNDVLDAALDHVDITLAEARKRLDDRAVARLEARLATLRHEWGADWVDWLFGRKVDELAPGHADGPASRECRGQALHWLDGNLRRVAQLTPDALALFDHRLEELGRLEPANAEQLERAIDYAQAQIQIQAGDIERRRTVIFQTPGADSAYRDLFRAGFGQSHKLSLRALDRVEADLDRRFDEREASILGDPDGKAILRDARVHVLGEDRRPTTLPERGGVIEDADGRLQERRTAAAVEQLLRRPGGDQVAVAALDRCVPAWRGIDSCTSNVHQTIETAAQDADRTAPATAEDQLVLDAEREFSDAGSDDWREASRALRGRTDVDERGCAISQRLSDRARLRELVSRREQTSRGLVKRLVDWLRRRVEQLLRAFRPREAVELDTSRAVACAAPAPSANSPSAAAGPEHPELPSSVRAAAPEQVAATPGREEAAREEPPSPAAHAPPPHDIEDQEDAGKRHRADAEKPPEQRLAAPAHEPREGEGSNRIEGSRGDDRSGSKHRSAGAEEPGTKSWSR